MKKTLLLTLGTVFMVPNAYALDLGHDVTIKGFGTAGLVYSDNNQADFIDNNYLNPRGAGRTEDVSVVNDTKLGLQMDWQATEHLSFTAQAVSKQDPNNSWIPELQWAFAKYKILPNFDIRAGRIRPAVYMLSDTLDVNFANPWVRPPIEFYSQAPVTHMEGVDFLFRLETGPVNWLVQPYYGNSLLSMTNKREFTARNLAGFNLSASYNDFSFRIGYGHTSSTTNIPGFESSVRPSLLSLCALNSIACTELTAIDNSNKPVAFASVGLGWDNGDYFLTGEFAKRSTSSLIPETLSGYISGGARFGKFTPYATYSQMVVLSPTSYSGATGAAASTINGIVTNVFTNNPLDQNTKTLGLRYELFTNIALKAQWDRIDTNPKEGQANTGGGIFNNATSSFKNNSNSVDLFSTSVDFIF